MSQTQNDRPLDNVLDAIRGALQDAHTGEANVILDFLEDIVFDEDTHGDGCTAAYIIACMEELKAWVDYVIDRLHEADGRQGFVGDRAPLDFNKSVAAIKELLFKDKLENALLASIKREMEDEYSAFCVEHVVSEPKAWQQALLARLREMGYDDATTARNLLCKQQRMNGDI